MITGLLIALGLAAADLAAAIALGTFIRRARIDSDQHEQRYPPLPPTTRKATRP